jgi:tyrosinase
MNVDIRFPAYDGQNRTFVTWRPVKVDLSLVAPPAGTQSVDVILSAKSLANGGKLLFAHTLTHAGTPTLDVNLPTNGAAASVWIGGAFPSASLKYGDVAVEVRDKASGTLLGKQDLMVRIRKNANALSNPERDRFLAALATLNGAGSGRYVDFRDMHVGGLPDQEAHGGPGFLSWHRAYLLDFERELQAIDAEVSLPYWRFDQAAPKVFTRTFMGVGNALGQVQFAPSNPLTSWFAFGIPGVQRGTGVGPSTVPALASEAQTLAMGGTPHPTFGNFRFMQGNPHGSAHNSHGAGWITNPTTAPRDPIFFLLHCNVDRLWSKWQWATRIHNPADPDAFPVGAFNIGHNLSDLLWPWCGPNQPHRPAPAPGGAMTASSMTAAPGPRPAVKGMIDYFGIHAVDHQDFAYDDVPFQN